MEKNLKQRVEEALTPDGYHMVVFELRCTLMRQIIKELAEREKRLMWSLRDMVKYYEDQCDAKVKVPGRLWISGLSIVDKARAALKELDIETKDN